MAVLGRENFPDALGYKARPGFLKLGIVDILGLAMLHFKGLFCAL